MKLQLLNNNMLPRPKASVQRGCLRSAGCALPACGQPRLQGRHRVVVRADEKGQKGFLIGLLPSRVVVTQSSLCGMIFAKTLSFGPQTTWSLCSLKNSNAEVWTAWTEGKALVRRQVSGPTLPTGMQPLASSVQYCTVVPSDVMSHARSGLDRCWKYSTTILCA